MTPVALAMLLPAITAAFTVNHTRVPGVIVKEADTMPGAHAQVAARDSHPTYEFGWNIDSTSCSDPFDYKFAQSEPHDCATFAGGPPHLVYFNNPRDPNSDNNIPYWNLILYFHGDSCPVIGHPVQCDSHVSLCYIFTEDKPLSYNIVQTVGGDTNCDGVS